MNNGLPTEKWSTSSAHDATMRRRHSPSLSQYFYIVFQFFILYSYDRPNNKSPFISFPLQRLQNAKELQNILTVIMQSDSDGDHTLGDQELEMLLLRLSSFSAADETKLRLALQNYKNETVSTTTLYSHLVTSGSFAQEADEFNYTFGYSQWLFDENA